MNIGVDIRVLGTGRTSGVEEYTEHLLEHLLPLDPSVQFKLFYAGRTPLRRRPWMALPNVRLFDTGRSNRMLLATTRLFKRPRLDRLVGGADTFFFPHFLLGATSPGVRRVMTWHDLSYERMPELFSWGRRAWHHIQMRPRRQAAGADRIIAVSQSTADDLETLYRVPRERVAVIRSGVPASVQRAGDDEISAFRRTHDLYGRCILALGTVEPRKNLEALIFAFERIATRVSDAQLVIAGPRGWLGKPIARRIAESPAAARIRCLGEIPPVQRTVLLSLASVLVYPSLLEGFGFPPLEAMACGTPVIAGANSSLFETVGDAGVLVDPYAITHLAQAVTTVLDDLPMRNKLIRKGQERVRRFTWEQTAQETLRVLMSA